MQSTNFAVALSYRSIDLIRKQLARRKRTYCRRRQRRIAAVKKLSGYIALQTKDISDTRIRSTIGVHVVSSIGLYCYLSKPQDLLMILTGMLFYVVLVSATLISLLAKIPKLRSIASDAGYKWGAILLYAYFVFLTQQYAKGWVGEALEANGSIAGGSLYVMAFLLLLLGCAFFLFLGAITCEAALFVTMVVMSIRTSARIYWILLAVAVFTLTCAFAANTALSAFNNLRGPLMSRVLFEFDAAPAGRCLLTDAERRMAQGPNSVLKVLPIATSQREGVLLMRSPGLLDPLVVIKGRGRSEWTDRQVYSGRIVECFRPSPVTDADARGLPPIDYR